MVRRLRPTGWRVHDAVMDRLRIPSSLALLGLCFTGCGKAEEESIVGVWDATMLDGEALPYVEVGDYGEMTSTRIELTIADDLTGTYSLLATYTYPGEPAEEGGYTFGLMVDSDDGPEFVVTIPEIDERLDCTVTGMSMKCVGVGNTLYTFKRRDPGPEG